MNDSVPSTSGPAGLALMTSQAASGLPFTSFDREELSALFSLYGTKVAAGEWRDYAIDFLKDRAVFSVYRRACEHPLYRIEKNPKLNRKQGAYSIVAATGLILKRGHDLSKVLRVLDKRLRIVG